MKKSVDYLIIGQGIAGSTLARTLEKRNKSFIVIDKYFENSSSRVAAGLINPITGRRLTKTWMADTIFPFMTNFYQEWEKDLGIKALHLKRIFVPFDSIEKQNFWLSKSSDKEYLPYVDEYYNKDKYKDLIDCPYEGVEVLQGGYLDLQSLLPQYREHLKEKNSFLEEEFDFNQLKISDTEISYKDITAKKILFAEGTGVIHNPYFKWLPFRRAKGEILILEMPSSIDLNEIVSRNGWLFKYQDGTYKLGSTFAWDDLSPQPTEKMRLVLEEKIESFWKAEYTIKKQIWGVRPASYDRKPFIGLHPKSNKLGVFNGFGTKGVSLSPYLANNFFDSIEKGQELNKECDIKRCL